MPRSVKAVQAAKDGQELLTSLTKLGGAVEEFRKEGRTITEQLLQIKDKVLSTRGIKVGWESSETSLNR